MLHHFYVLYLHSHRLFRQLLIPFIEIKNKDMLLYTGLNMKLLRYLT